MVPMLLNQPPSLCWVQSVGHCCIQCCHGSLARIQTSCLIKCNSIKHCGLGWRDLGIQLVSLRMKRHVIDICDREVLTSIFPETGESKWEEIK